jgi:hypothetical protein
MPSLSYVYPYPAKGRADLPADEDEVADVAIRGCRSVAELYSEAVAPLGLANGVSELRLFTSHHPDLEDVRATVHVDKVWEGFEMGFVQVPTVFAARTPRVRALMLLEAVHGMVCRLGEARGWDAAALETCRQHVLDSDLEYRWSSAPKTSPDRRHEARAVFRLLPDGHGRARLEVVRRDDGAVVCSSGEALAMGTSPGFRRAARSLRWEGKDVVSMVPWDWVPAMRGGRVSLRRAGEHWVGRVEEHTAGLPVPQGDPSSAALPVHVEGRGASAVEQPPTMVFVGGGPVQTPQIRRFHDAFSAEMRRFTAPAGQAWWQDAGVRLLELQVLYERESPRVRGRRSDHTLRIFVDRPGSTLPTGDPTPLARAVAEEVVALVRRRTGLGPHPAYP